MKKDAAAVKKREKAAAVEAKNPRDKMANFFERTFAELDAGLAALGASAPAKAGASGVGPSGLQCKSCTAGVVETIFEHCSHAACCAACARCAAQCPLCKCPVDAAKVVYLHSP